MSINIIRYWRDYYELTKPRVVALMLLTSVVGMLLAAPYVPWSMLVIATIGIGFAGGSAAVINQLVDQKIDALMHRTKKRPLPTGRVSNMQALTFAAILAVLGLCVLYFWVNTLTMILTFATLLGYAVIYTVFLKRATPQNIVIGGIAGATPPLLGWTAVTNKIEAAPLVLVLLIFTWTPPHFWALAVARYEEYAKAEIPMLPVTHGIRFTTFSTLLYTLLMIAVSLLPCAIGMSSYIYLYGAIALNLVFLYLAIELHRTQSKTVAIKTFFYSIYYLMLLFILLLIDHYSM